MIDIKIDPSINSDISALMARFAELPRHIARKHLQAAMRRAVKDGVPVLRRWTPPTGTRRGRRKAGERRSTGDLRRAVTTKAKYIPKGGVVYGVLGYKYGWESRKAIWLDRGTKTIRPRSMIDHTMATYGGPCSRTLAKEMAAALEKAAKELESGKNPGGRKS